MNKNTLDKTFKEVNKAENNRCPICNKEFTMLTGLVKIGNIAYHLSCIEKTGILKESK